MPTGNDLEIIDGSRNHKVWLLISGFLSSKAPSTQKTYLQIVKEWSLFLGAKAGTSEAAKKVISAGQIEVFGFRAWLQSQPGQNPRHAYHSPLKSHALALPHKITKINRKNDGRGSTLTNSTIAKKFAALRRIYRLLLASDLGLKINPFDTDRVPPPPRESGQKRPTEMVEFEKIKDLIESVDISTTKGLRDKTILALLFGGGLRRSEVTSLRLSDFGRSSEGTYFVELKATKNKKDAKQALPNWAGKLLEDLVNTRKQSKATPGDFIFVSYRGKGGLHPTPLPISDSGLYKLFKKYCSDAGLLPHYSPHSARATAITKLLADGFDHRSVQEFSRHSSIQMVEVYDKRRISVDENPAKALDYGWGSNRSSKKKSRL